MKGTINSCNSFLVCLLIFSQSNNQRAVVGEKELVTVYFLGYWFYKGYNADQNAKAFLL